MGSFRFETVLMGGMQAHMHTSIPNVAAAAVSVLQTYESVIIKGSILVTAAASVVDSPSKLIYVLCIISSTVEDNVGA